tara:strand:- start:275 stop:766 length:492 start_codon:yes stop_codon:yes gene_type:complete
MITAKVVKKGNSLSKISKNVKKLDGENVQIGYFAEQGVHKGSKMTYASLMALLEYGNEDIPKRPIFTIAAFQNSPEKDTRVKRAVRAWNKELLTSDNSKALLDKLGRMYRKSIGDLFGDTSAIEGNHPTTIRLKGRDDPLRDTGDLKRKLSFRNSLDKEIKKK